MNCRFWGARNARACVASRNRGGAPRPAPCRFPPRPNIVWPSALRKVTAPAAPPAPVPLYPLPLPSTPYPVPTTLYPLPSTQYFQCTTQRTLPHYLPRPRPAIAQPRAPAPPPLRHPATAVTPPPPLPPPPPRPALAPLAVIQPSRRGRVGGAARRRAGSARAALPRDAPPPPRADAAERRSGSTLPAPGSPYRIDTVVAGHGGALAGGAAPGGGAA